MVSVGSAVPNGAQAFDTWRTWSSTRMRYVYIYIYIYIYIYLYISPIYPNINGESDDEALDLCTPCCKVEKHVGIVSTVNTSTRWTPNHRTTQIGSPSVF